jgi:hypothetical protein
LNAAELRRHVTTDPEHLQIWDGDRHARRDDIELREWHAMDHALHRRGHSHELRDAVAQDGTGR